MTEPSEPQPASAAADERERWVRLGQEAYLRRQRRQGPRQWLRHTVRGLMAGLVAMGVVGLAEMAYLGLAGPSEHRIGEAELRVVILQRLAGFLAVALLGAALEWRRERSRIIRRQAGRPPSVDAGSSPGNGEERPGRQ